MNIVHVCLNGPYNDNWGYQDNLIPKYHKKFGNTVTVIAQNKQHNENSGEIEETDTGDYFLQDGVRVIRVSKQRSFIKKFADVFSPYDIYDLLITLKPDFIIVHGLIGSVSALQVYKYIKGNTHCAAVADIHQDFYNSPVKSSIKYTVIRSLHRMLNRKMYSCYRKIYYMAPSCKKYAQEYYKVPEDMLELLPLGFDADLIDSGERFMIREEIRKKYNYNENDIIVCHGGKLDSKKMTSNLIVALAKLHKEDERIKLIIFGSFNADVKSDLENRILENNDFVNYVGMLTSEEYYKIYLASDIAAFPGSQSVLWQQAIASGLAVFVKWHTGVEYLDLGGNIGYFSDSSVEEIFTELKNAIKNGKYKHMKEVAEDKGTSFFSYERISKKMLEYAPGDKL